MEPGELCVMISLTIETYRSPAICLDFGNFDFRPLVFLNIFVIIIMMIILIVILTVVQLDA